jgi:hypothetical protein
MGTPATICNNKNKIFLYCILIAFSLISALFIVKNIKLATDSLRYGLISQQILSGNGIRIPAIRWEDNYIPVNGAIPYLEQPPLLPILLALLGGVTPNNFLPAQMLNTICHVGIALFTFLLMVNLYDKKYLALLTGILVTFSFPLLKLTQVIISEPLFIVLTVAAVYFLTLLRHSNHYQFRWFIFLASIFTTASIMTRWAGISLIAVFSWELLMLIKNKNPESKHAATYLALAIPIVTTVALFVRNYLLSGTIRGFNQPSPGRTYMEAFTGTTEMVFEQFQFGRNSIILIALFLVLFVISIIASSGLRKEVSKLLNSGMDSTMIFILVYTLLICVIMAKKQAQFELRYVSPLVPFLYVIIILITVFVWKTIRFSGFSKLSFIGMILSLSLIAFGSLYKTYLNLAEFSYKQEKVYSIVDSCTYKWLKNNYGTHDIITTNRPYHVSFFGGYSTIVTPYRKFDWNITIPENMESVLPYRMSIFGSRVLVLFAEVEAQYDGSYLARLFNKREDNDKFIIVHKCPDGVVYRMKE